MESFRRSIDDIENAIEEANEHTENMKQIQDALATPFGASAEFDEVWIGLFNPLHRFTNVYRPVHTVNFQDA